MGTKRRVLEYLTRKKIRRTDFYAATGVKRGLLDTDKMDATVKDTDVAKILAAYPDINSEWLITGEGNMLKQPCNGGTINNFSGGSIYSPGGENNRNGTVKEGAQAYQAAAKLREAEIERLIAQYRDFIDQQATQIRTKDEQIAHLLSIIASMQKG